MTFKKISLDQKGSVLLLVIFIASLMAFIPIGAELLKNSRRKVKMQANSGEQALNVARAGLTDAVAWFRRQATQPVRDVTVPDNAFFPRQASDDTDNESIGLVKEYPLGEFNNLYARYEVVRQTTNTATNSHYVHDITALRVSSGTAGQGLAWYIESVGYVYQRKSAAAAYNVAPNVIVGRARVATEIRRVSVTPPVASAVVANERQDGTVNTSCGINGGAAYGAVYYTSSGSTNLWQTGTLTLPSAIDLAAGYGTAMSQATIFGVSDYELRMMADYNVTNTSQLPATGYPSMALVYINGNATFNDTRPLRGGGILFVKGTLTIENTSNTLFSGVIYATDDITIDGPALISGIVFAEDKITLNQGSDTSFIQYDSDIVASIQQDVGQYRENKGTYHVFSALK